MTSMKLFVTAALFCGSLMAFGQNCAMKSADAPRTSVNEKLSFLSTELILTPDQVKKAELIMQGTEQEAKAIKDGEGTEAAMAKLADTENNKLAEILTATQASKFKELRARGRVSTASCCATGKAAAAGKGACCAGGKHAEAKAAEATPTPAANTAH